MIYVSFSLRRRIGTRVWRRLHWLTYLVFVLATMHGLAAGSDSDRPWALALYGAAVGGVVAAAAWRTLVPAASGRRASSRIALASIESTSVRDSSQSSIASAASRLRS